MGAIMKAKLVVPLIALLAVTGCKGEKSAAGKPASNNSGTGVPIELQYVPEGFPFGSAVSEGFALHMFETPAAGFRKMPPEGSAKRYYDEFTIGGKPHLVITEATEPPRIWFDENTNGDLTDDRGPFPGEKNALLPNFYSIQILYEKERVVVPYRMWLFESKMGGTRFYPGCHWRGTITVEGQLYPIAAFDSNADGDYSNDPLLIDMNGDGKADDGEKLLPGNTVSVAGKNVTLNGVSQSGLTVRLAW